MRKGLLYIFLILTALTACNDDREEEMTAMPQEQEMLTLEIPIQWVPTSGTAAPLNRAGDPGLDDTCPEPKYLYLFTWMRTANNTSPHKYDFYFVAREDIQPELWTLKNEGSSNAYYELNTAVKLNVVAPILTGYADGDRLGRTYAIASGRKLSTTQLEGIVGDSYKSVIASPEKPVEFTGTSGEEIDAQLRNALLDLSAAKCEGGTRWTSTNYRDLYSSPYNELRTDANGIANGVIVYNATTFPDAKAGHGAVRLYHSAAKIDFQWEVAADLRATTAIESITVTGLPTQCRIFSPTENPATSAANPELNYAISAANPDGITINPGNKWIGRQYFYALQPSDAVIRYGVTFEDVAGSGARPSKSLSFTPDPVNDVFTAWYRIPAVVN